MDYSLRSWRYCKRTRNKVLAAARGEWGVGISRGFAARFWRRKTLFRTRPQYRQLRRLDGLKIDWFGFEPQPALAGEVLFKLKGQVSI